MIGEKSKYEVVTVLEMLCQEILDDDQKRALVRRLKFHLGTLKEGD